MQDHPSAAIVSPLRAGLVVLDLDGCTDLLPLLEDAAGHHGAALVYLAASGSPGSAHAVYLCPSPTARRGLASAVKAIRAWAGATGLDLRTAREALRLPGAPSLKPGRGPVAAARHLGGGALEAMTWADALARAVDAVQAVAAGREGLEATPGAWTVKDARKALGKLLPRSRRTQDTGAAPQGKATTGLKAPARLAAAGLVLDAAARAALATPAPAGSDRTLHALKAARHLWRCGAREWGEVAPVVMSAPATRRWAQEGTHKAAVRWEREALKWVDHCPGLSPDDAALLEDAQAAAGRLPARLEPVLAFILSTMRHAGAVEDVGISQRCPVVAGVAKTRATGGRYLEELEGLGVLTRARRWDEGPLTDATLWTLNPVDQWGVAGIEPNYIPPTTPLEVTTHPVWLDLPAMARRFWAVLRSAPCSAAAAARTLGVSARTARSWRAALEGAGLIQRAAGGAWSVVPLEASPAAVEALEALEARRAVVARERAAWRAEVDGLESTAPDDAAGVDAPASGGGGKASGVDRLRVPWRSAARAMQSAARAAVNVFRRAGGSSGRRGDASGVDAQAWPDSRSAGLLDGLPDWSGGLERAGPVPVMPSGWLPAGPARPAVPPDGLTAAPADLQLLPTT